MTDLATPAVKSSARVLTQIQNNAVRTRAAEIANKLRSGQIMEVVDLDKELTRAALEVNLATSFVEEALVDQTRSFGETVRHNVPDEIWKRLGIHVPKGTR